MNFEKPPTTPQEAPEEKQENMEAKKIMQYMAMLGEDITRNAKEVEIMMNEAEKRGIEVNIDEKVKDFEATKEIEVQLINIREKINDLKAELYTQGLKMTKEEMEENFEKKEQ
jgi:cell division septation protein DedD